MNGYQRAAWTLRDLSLAEQEWLLLRLSAEDRDKIIAARAALEADAKRESDAIALQQTAADTIKHWDGETIAKLLTDEPLWVTVLILSQLEPALAASTVDEFGSPRAEAVGGALERVPRTLKPRVAEILLRALMEKSERRRGKPERADFAATLRRFAGDSAGASRAP